MSAQQKNNEDEGHCRRKEGEAIWGVGKSEEGPNLESLRTVSLGGGRWEGMAQGRGLTQHVLWLCPMALSIPETG